MRLSDIFSPTPKRTSNANESLKAEASASERFQKQLTTIAPGRTLQGEIVGKNGGEVRIKVAEDVYFTAKLDNDVNVEEGQTIVFEIRNNGKNVTLSPLFTNTATADNVMKALRMANLPIQNTTVTMTDAMMQQGMSIDSKSLLAMFKEVMAHPGANAADVVKLHQMGIPVDENSLQQMKNYGELTHQLVRGMTDVLAELPAAFAEVMQNEGSDSAVALYQKLMQVLSGESVTQQTDALTNPEIAANPNNTPGINQGNVAITAGNEQQINTNMILENQGQLSVENLLIATESMENAALSNGVANTEVSQTGNPTENMFFNNTGALFTVGESHELANLLGELPPEIYPQAKDLAQQVRQGAADVRELFQFLAKAPAMQNNAEVTVLAEIFKSDALQKLFHHTALRQWTIEPEQLMEKGVKEVYERLTRQLHGMSEALADHGAAQSAAAKNVTNLAQNIDFMNQINQLYTYVQLPLKLQNGQKNGELYVYTNKRSLAQKDGNVSALLHLDMEHLGPVDVYVALQNNRATTRFTVRDDEMLDFLNDHMHILNARLEKKGYSFKWEMTTRGEEPVEESPIERILQTEKNATILSQYAFDVRT